MKRTFIVCTLLATVGVSGCNAAAVKPNSEAKTSPPGTASAVTQPAFHGPLPALDTVDFVDKMNGFVAGKGIILATTNGGKTWVRQFNGKQTFTSLQFINSQNGWAITEDGRLWQTSNGGQLWRHMAGPVSQSGRSQMVTQVQFVTAHTGFVLADGKVWWTANGGQTWRVKTPTRQVGSIDFLNATVGFAAAENRLYRTRDGGQTWTQIYAAPVTSGSGWLPTVAAVDDKHLWLLLRGESGGMSQYPYAVFQSVDGGRHWRARLSEGAFHSLYPTVKTSESIDANAGPVLALNDKTAYFFGNCSACYGWGTVSMTATLDGGNAFSHRVVGGTTAVMDYAVSFPTAEDGWMVFQVPGGGNQGEILHTTDAGRSWTVALPTNVGPIPGRTNGATVKPLPNTTSVPGISSPTSLWQDGEVSYQSKWEPLYVAAQYGMENAPHTPFLQMTDKLVQSAKYLGIYPCPRDIGRLTITGITNNGTVVHVKSTTGVTGTFDLRYYAWQLKP